MIATDNISQHLDNFSNVFIDRAVTDTQKMNLSIIFNQPISPLTLGSPPYNPFLIQNLNRQVEIHLLGKSPTDLANMALFNKKDDNSDFETNQLYRTQRNLPWALDVPFKLNHMREFVDLSLGYTKFDDWAESGGSQYSDWYEDKEGYRQDSKIFK